MSEYRTLHCWKESDLRFCESTLVKTFGSWLEGWGNDHKLNVTCSVFTPTNVLAIDDFINLNKNTGETAPVWFTKKNKISSFVRQSLLGINGFAATNVDNISLGDEMLNKIVDDFWVKFDELNIVKSSGDEKNSD